MRKIISLVVTLTMIVLSLPMAMAAAPPPAEAKDVNAVAEASVAKLPGSKNELTITVRDVYDAYTATFLINNNAAGIYTVGEYDVYVDTKGNTQIRACYIVSYNSLNINVPSLIPMALNKIAGEKFMLAPVMSVLGLSADDLVWKSSNTSVATVDQNGVVACLSSGTAVIKLTSASLQVYQ